MNDKNYSLLDQLMSPADLRKLDEEQLPQVADELRAYLLESISRSGGHFSAGLGCIELTVALHYCYETPHDRIIWDVGHQAYPHKILTGRRDSIDTIKKTGGLAPFPTRQHRSAPAWVWRLRRPIKKLIAKWFLSLVTVR